MKVTTEPTRSGVGLVIRVDGKAAAWIDASGGTTIGRAYRAALAGAPVPRRGPRSNREGAEESPRRPRGGGDGMKLDVVYPPELERALAVFCSGLEEAARVVKALELVQGL